LLDTTPSGHAVNTPVYKVQVHPPGRQFPPNGMPVFRIPYRNDDGMGPGYGKDSHLTFTAPADGEYVIRIADVRGEQSERHAYRLSVREPRPDFRLSMAPEHPNIPAGSRIPVEVTADRLDGFAGEIRVSLEGLTDGVSASEATIEAGENSATLLLTASAELPKGPRGQEPLVLVGRTDATGAPKIRRTAPANGKARVSILGAADLTVTTAAGGIAMRPGGSETVSAAIVRHHQFGQRVPVDLKNLPFGVRVLDVGLNGVLITEAERARRFTIVCDPWVKPQKRWVYCTARVESDPPVEVAAAPILLEIQPGR
jgi:hypothetical protein